MLNFRSVNSAIVSLLFLFLPVAVGHASPVINTYADGKVGSNTYTDPKTATAGNIISNLFIDLGIPGMTDAGNAIAAADINGDLAVRAGVGSGGGTGIQFDAMSVWTDTLTSNGTFAFHIGSGDLMLSSLYSGSAEYQIEIWNNGAELWSSYAMISTSLSGTSITKSGTDLNGAITYDPTKAASFSYTFGAYDGMLDVTAGTLTYSIECIKQGSGTSVIGNVYLDGSGFTGSFTPASQVAEPASALLLSAGLLSLVALRRRR